LSNARSSGALIGDGRGDAIADGPACAAYDGATVIPLRDDAALKPPYRVGGFDAAGAVIPQMRHLFGDGKAAADPLPESPAAEIAGHCVYGGLLTPHFGHFLLDSLARLWMVRRTPGLPIVWHRHKAAVAWQGELLGLLGLGQRRCIEVDRPLRFERLSVPAPGFVIRHRFTAAQAEALACLDPGGARQGERVWLSRSGLRRGPKRVAGEAEVEAILAARGWRIFAPERHGIAEQVAALAGADVLAGIEGSAFHTLVLVRRFAGRVVMVPRRAEGVQVNRNHHLICARRGIPLAFVGGLLRADARADGRPGLAFADPGAAAAALLAA
jgi:capsular polysaccharide biosynthesis protein